jgi:hypothetical protein
MLLVTWLADVIGHTHMVSRCYCECSEMLVLLVPTVVAIPILRHREQPFKELVALANLFYTVQLSPSSNKPC